MALCFIYLYSFLLHVFGFDLPVFRCPIASIFHVLITISSSVLLYIHMYDLTISVSRLIFSHLCLFLHSRSSRSSFYHHASQHYHALAFTSTKKSEQQYASIRSLLSCLERRTNSLASIFHSAAVHIGVKRLAGTATSRDDPARSTPPTHYTRISLKTPAPNHPPSYPLIINTMTIALNDHRLPLPRRPPGPTSRHSGAHSSQHWGWQPRQHYRDSWERSDKGYTALQMMRSKRRSSTEHRSSGIA